MSPRSPRLPPSVRRLFRLPRRRASMLRELDEELASHFAMRVDQLRALGMSEVDAMAEARRRFGDADEYHAWAERRVTRRARRLRFSDWVAEWGQDARFALRQVKGARGFTAIVVLTLALGIGANTAIFSVVHRLLLAPMPYANGGRIVMPVGGADAVFPFRDRPSAELMRAWLARTHTIEGIAGAAELMFTVQPDGSVDTITTAIITSNFLSILGERPELGRTFRPEEERTSAPTVAMISHAMWQRAYGGRRDVLGRTVEHEGRPVTIVGVTPPGLAVPLSTNATPDIWLPGPLEQAGDGNGAIGGPDLYALLRPGASVEAATAELRTVAAGLPDSVRGSGDLRVVRAQDLLDGRERRAVQVLFFAVGALLLIACANVANLLLARAWTRQREFAVRGALGASRWRLARQVLSESVLLGLSGGVLGIGVAWLALRLIVALRPPALDHLADVHINPAVLLWTLGVSLVTGVLFGCAPALLAGARAVGDVLRRETRGSSAGATSRRVRSALTVMQIAMSLVLLVGSGLLVRSFAALQDMRLGYEPRGLVYADVITGRQTRERKPDITWEILDRIRSLPGVTGAAIGTMPGKGFIGMGGLEVETDRAGHTTRVPMLGTIFITPDYFRVAKIAVLEGRLPDSTVVSPDAKAHIVISPEVMVNREFARRVWPHGGAIGARLREPRSTPGPWSTIVGIVDDTRTPEVHGEVAAIQVYSLYPARLGNVPFIVRTRTSADVSAPMVKHAIASLDPGIYVRAMTSGDTYLRNGLAPTRFAMALLTAFALLALALAAVGLYGVIAYGVTQRTREIGVRIALGAEPHSIVARVMGSGARLALAGVVIGTALALASARVLRSMLYDVSPDDPLTIVAIVAIVVIITLVASYVPARRALRIEPTEALRAD
ncbi:MAG TPA: ABC transporter permease [Gemmatimonadaceae bacterium]|nr:ABC transporter permease [Gemmatimonadaceae bacterium]